MITRPCSAALSPSRASVPGKSRGISALARAETAAEEPKRDPTQSACPNGGGLSPAEPRAPVAVSTTLAEFDLGSIDMAHCQPERVPVAATLALTQPLSSFDRLAPLQVGASACASRGAAVSAIVHVVTETQTRRRAANQSLLGCTGAMARSDAMRDHVEVTQKGEWLQSVRPVWPDLLLRLQPGRCSAACVQMLWRLQRAVVHERACVWRVRSGITHRPPVETACRAQ